MKKIQNPIKPVLPRGWSARHSMIIPHFVQCKCE